MKPHVKLILGLSLGIILGTFAHSFSQTPGFEWIAGINTYLFMPVGQAFLKLIFMVVVPMVFSALVMGVHELGSHRGLGKVVRNTLFFTILSSAASVLIGVGLVNALQPGQGFQLSSDVVQAQAGSVDKIKANAAAAKPFQEALLDIIPKNPIEAAVKALDGEMIALMFFALVFGLALSFSLPQNHQAHQKSAIIQVLEQIFEACMVIMAFVMRFAPFAVFALVFNTSFKFGYSLLSALLYYVLIVVAGLLLQQFGVYTLLLKLFTNYSPLKFFQNCREVYLYAFATASSNATLPRSLETAETKLKLPKEISRFVLTVGSTANQNGTALFEGVTVLFLAQVYGIDLTLAQQVQVVLMSILAGIGTAGVPGGSLPLIMILLQQMGIPPEALGIVLGVDRFLDMCRTTVNVSGDLVIAALVS
ncbi:MAG: dicarboxylate/amino acid:cation symporter, partial [Bdellovibrionales bacterium]